MSWQREEWFQNRVLCMAPMYGVCGVGGHSGKRLGFCVLPASHPRGVRVSQEGWSRGQRKFVLSHQKQCYPGPHALPNRAPPENLRGYSRIQGQAAPTEGSETKLVLPLVSRQPAERIQPLPDKKGALVLPQRSA